MAQAAPLTGLHCPMVAVPRPPRGPSRGPQAQAAQCKDGRSSIEPTSVGSSAGKHLQLRSAYRAQRQAPLPLRLAPNFNECQRARRIRAQHPTRMRVNARKSSYGMKQSTDQSICKNERTTAGIPQRKQTNSNQCH